jgi:uncharacterized protein YjgD (DUF1641 family)
MAENETIDVGAALTNKLKEKPQALEHLLNIIDRLDTLDEFSAMLQAQKDGATDMMVQRVADNITTGLSIMDSFSGDEQLSMIKAAGNNAESLKKSIETIAELEKSGTLQSLKDMGDFVAGFSKGMTDSMVERMAGTAEKLTELTDSLADENMAGLIKKVQHVSDALGTSLDKIAELEKSGTLQSLKDMGDFVAGFSKGMTDSMVERMAGTAEKLTELTDSLADENMAGLIKKVQHVSDALGTSLDKIAELEKSGTLQSLKDMGDFVAGFSKGMTDSMVERMAGTAEKLTELSDIMANYNLKPLLDMGESFINSGTLDDLIELANAAAAARRMLTDGLVDRVVNTAQAMVEAIMTQVDVKEVIKSINRSTIKTINNAEEEKYAKGGILSLLSMAKNPEIMQGLKFMMLLSKNLTSDIKEHADDIFISGEIAKKEFVKL